MLSYDNIYIRRVSRVLERNNVYMGKPTTAEIVAFLRNFKRLAQSNFIFIQRKKNLDSISQLGIKISQVKSIIMQLTYENYHKGPERDKDRKKGNIWEFGVIIDHEEVYVKLSDDFSHNIAKCISFHKAEFKISYPYKKGG